jgi:hypothetical protein
LSTPLDQITAGMIKKMRMKREKIVEEVVENV